MTISLRQATRMFLLLLLPIGMYLPVSALAAINVRVDAGPSYAINASQWGLTANAYASIMASDGWELELMLGYHRSPLQRLTESGFCEVSEPGTEGGNRNCLPSIFDTVMVNRIAFELGTRYDFSRLLSLEPWHPFLAAHLGGMAVIGEGNTELASNAAIGVDYVSRQRYGMGLSLQYNWSSEARGGWVVLACEALYRF